jgi:integrase
MGLYKRGSVWWMSFIDPNTGKQQRRSTETEDKEQAKRIFDKIKGRIAEGKWFERLPGHDLTFKEAMDKYLTGYSLRSKAASSHVRDQCGAKHLLPVFGECVLADIGPSIISEYKVKRREDGASAQTVNLELSLMSHVFTIAMKEWEWVKENPVRMVSRERKDRSKERWLTLEEEGRLLKVSPPWLQDIITFAIHTGLRQSEILDMKWSQVDFGRRTITIMEQKNRGVDTLPVDETVMRILTRRKGRPGCKETDNVFPNGNNNRLNNRNLLRAFYSAMKKAGIQDFRFHDLRHTFATRLVQSGVDLYTVQKLGRWKDAAMVMRYAHHNPESLRRGIQVMDNLRPSVITNLSQSSKKRGHKPHLRLVTP